MPAGILEYFSEEEDTHGGPHVGRGISSAETRRKVLSRKGLDRYSASRIH
jgi:hypothetical protein